MKENRENEEKKKVSGITFHVSCIKYRLRDY